MPEVKGLLPITVDEESLEGLSEEERAELVHLKETAQACIRRFLGFEEGSAVSLPKTYRAATFRWLQAVDHALWCVTQMGLEQFAGQGAKVTMMAPAQQESIAKLLAGSPRSCAIAADQMSVGPTGVTYLQSKDLDTFVDLLMDPPHRFWNSEKLGLLQGDAWEPVLLTTIPYNINEGPWHSAAFWAQLCAAKDAYLSSTNLAEDPLFLNFLPLIARDLGREHEVVSAALVADVASILRDSSQLSNKGPRLALCRWYSWVDSHEYWMSSHWLRALLMTVWALGCGVLTKQAGRVSLSLASAKPSLEGKKETMSEQAQKAARIRAKGKNMLHTSLLVLLNPHVQRRANCVYWALQPMRLFHGLQVQACKGVLGNLDWSAGMAAGPFNKPLAETWQVLTDPVRLQRCGFAVSLEEVGRVGLLGPSSSGRVEEATWCRWLVGLLCSLERNRVRHLLFYTAGPGLLAGLLSTTPSARATCLASLKSLWAGWKAAEGLAHPEAVTARERSWMRRPLIAQVFEALADSRFEGASALVLEIVRSMFAAVSTKAVEDSFQRLRVVEQRGQSNARVTAGRMWHVLITKGILRTLHHYDEVDFRTVGHKRELEELPRRPSRNLYRPQSRNTCLPLHTVSGKNAEVIT